jgi:hypothetical protein
MTGRAIGYPLAAFAIPLVWWFVGRRRGWRFPADADILITLPFLFDVAGNAANLYDTIDWWDDLNHFVNWAILVAAFGRVLVRVRMERVIAASLAIGFWAVTAVLWEFLEYITFIRNSPELKTAYTDTLFDLAMGLCGSVVAALLTVTVLWRRPATS